MRLGNVANDQLTIPPTSESTNSRRLIASPLSRTTRVCAEYHILVRELCCSSHPNGAATMSALGHKRTSAHVYFMSALPPKADMRPSCEMSGSWQKRTFAEQRKASYSNTSLAVAGGVAGAWSAVAFAVLRLIRRWNLVGVCTGELATFRPQ